MSDAAAMDPRTQVDAALSAGDLPAARAHAERYWRANPNAAAARFVIGRLDRLWPAGRVVDHRLAVLRSFTVEPVLPLLQADAALAGCRLVPWVGEFNAYGQEILDPASELYAHRPDTVILAVQTRDIAPGLWSGFAGLSAEAIDQEIETAVESLMGLVTQLRVRTPARILAHGLEPPLQPDLGLLDARRPLGQGEAVAAVNRALRARLAKVPSAYFLDYGELQARHGRARFVSEKKWATARLPLSVEALSWLAQDWWRHLSLFILPQAKVLALDLDNTLWGGILGEEGLAGLKLSDEYPGVFYKNLQRAVLDVARRGILIALVSKNNQEDALQVLDQHPDMLIRREHVAAMRIDWQPKAANLASIAEELNLGLESFVFVDDNPVECEAVRRSLPEVTVLHLGDDPSTYAALLRTLPGLERLEASVEDGARTRYYLEEGRRKDLLGQAESLEAFLASLDIRVEVTPIDAMTLARAAQLTQKTNQLNLTTRRYSQAQLEQRLATPRWAGYVLRAADRFGDNGIVGVALVEMDDEVCRIDTLLLSCRVIGRQIETAFLSVLAEVARQAGCADLEGWYLPTAKNTPARDVYAQAGFTRREAAETGELWGVDLRGDAVSAPPWVTVAPPTGRT